MKTVAILSRKGGTGKTTLATHLSVEAERAGHTAALIDLDPQASAARWGDHRKASSPAVIAAPASRLQQWLEMAEENGATLVILDTAPNAELASLDAARAASLVLIPCRPSLMDLEAIEPTIDIARLAKVPAHVILNAVPPAPCDLGNEARRAIQSYGVQCLPCELGQRVGFTHAYNHGLAVQEFEPNSKSSREVQALYKYIAKEMGV